MPLEILQEILCPADLQIGRSRIMFGQCVRSIAGGDQLYVSAYGAGWPTLEDGVIDQNLRGCVCVYNDRNPDKSRPPVYGAQPDLIIRPNYEAGPPSRGGPWGGGDQWGFHFSALNTGDLIVGAREHDDRGLVSLGTSPWHVKSGRASYVLSSGDTAFNRDPEHPMFSGLFGMYTAAQATDTFKHALYASSGRLSPVEVYERPSMFQLHPLYTLPSAGKLAISDDGLIAVLNERIGWLHVFRDSMVVAAWPLPRMEGLAAVGNDLYVSSPFTREVCRTPTGDGVTGLESVAQHQILPIGRNIAVNHGDGPRFVAASWWRLNHDSGIAVYLDGMNVGHSDFHHHSHFAGEGMAWSGRSEVLVYGAPGETVSNRGAKLGDMGKVFVARVT